MKTEIKTKKGLSAEMHGFTLMEVAMVLGIISIMTAVALIAIQSTRNKTELEAAANQLMASVREAQNYALTGKRDNESSLCVSYSLIPTLGSSQYSIEGRDSNGGSCGLTINQELGGGVVFNGGDIAFQSPHGAISGSGNFTLGRGTNNYYVCVNEAGLIITSSEPCII